MYEMRIKILKLIYHRFAYITFVKKWIWQIVLVFHEKMMKIVSFISFDYCTRNAIGVSQMLSVKKLFHICICYKIEEVFVSYDKNKKFVMQFKISKYFSKFSFLWKSVMLINIAFISYQLV